MLTSIYKMFLQEASGKPGPTTEQTLFIIGLTLLDKLALIASVVLSAFLVKLTIRFVTGLLKGAFTGVSANIKQSMSNSPVAWFAYDPQQDIFFSDMNS
jgi:hypothetical protein